MEDHREHLAWMCLRPAAVGTSPQKPTKPFSAHFGKMEITPQASPRARRLPLVSLWLLVPMMAMVNLVPQTSPQRSQATTGELSASRPSKKCETGSPGLAQGPQATTGELSALRPSNCNSETGNGKLDGPRETGIWTGHGKRETVAAAVAGPGWGQYGPVNAASKPAWVRINQASSGYHQASRGHPRPAQTRVVHFPPARAQGIPLPRARDKFPPPRAQSIPPRARIEFPHPRARAVNSPPRARTVNFPRARVSPHGVACRLGAPSVKTRFSRRPTVGRSRNRVSRRLSPSTLLFERDVEP